MPSQETTLHDNIVAHDPDDDDGPDEPTPLPKFQLLIVFLIQLAEPVTATVIYPFVNQFVRRTGVTKGDERKTGYYAGMIESVFFLAESLTVVQWGYLSDRFGRRPVLLLGPIGLTFAMLMFGLSTKFWPLVVYRCLQGVFNGNIGVSKSVIAEITDSTNMGDAYAMITLMWSLGSTTGPIIGGILSNPATRWPDTLGRLPVLRDNPYLLPCAVASFVAFSTFVIAFFGLKETLPSLVAQEQLEKQRGSYSISSAECRLIDSREGPSYGATQNQLITDQSSITPTRTESSSTLCASPIEKTQCSLRALVLGPLFFIFANHTFLALLDMCHAVLLPLMYSTSIPLGGLGLDPFKIGSVLGAFGFVNSFVQAKLLGRGIRKFGPRRLYIFSFSAFFVSFSMYPILSCLARRAGGVDTWVGICMAIQLVAQMMSFMAYGTIQVLIVQTVPEGGPMATVNGIAQMLGSGMRSIAPTFASSLFSVSLTRQLAGGNMVYFVLLAITVIGSCLSILLPKQSKKRNKSPPRRLATPQ